jgi:hypothetical protein
MRSRQLLLLMGFSVGVLGGAPLVTAADAITQPAQCSSNYAPAVACKMSDNVGADETHTMEFVFGPTHVRFVGKAQTGWWSGKLEGQPAMGYELNRGHIVFSTLDLKTTFEWWTPGNQHGKY